ncbi:unnamed protein product, partial [Meganyctiphanes norvegica]
TDEFSLSTEFVSHHFLIGSLLSEVRSALGEVGEVQRVAITVLRDLLAKHSFDDRYLQSDRPTRTYTTTTPICIKISVPMMKLKDFIGKILSVLFINLWYILKILKSQQSRIACLYFPIVTVLLENVKRLSWPAAPTSVTAQKKMDPRASSRTKSSRSGGGSIDMSTYSTPSRKGSRLNEVNSSYLAIIAGPGGLMTPQSTLLNGRSTSSLESEDHPPSATNSDLPEEDPEDDDGRNSMAAHSRNLSVAFAGENGPVRYDKLHPAEVRDLLLCFLHVLKHVTESHLVAWWNTLNQDNLTNFFTLMQ